MNSTVAGPSWSNARYNDVLASVAQCRPAPPKPPWQQDNRTLWNPDNRTLEPFDSWSQNSVQMNTYCCRVYRNYRIIVNHTGQLSISEMNAI